jgi:hypothetical protein
MCWTSDDERYNDGEAFKLTCRTEAGVIVTIIADNYYGYCKKEVKTQVSYAANLMGHVEEEHAGGAVVFACYSLGESFQANSKQYNGRTLDDVKRDYGHLMDIQPGGHGIDRQFPRLVYIPEDALADLRSQTVSWSRDGDTHSIPLLPDKVYMAPSGYKVRMEKHPAAPKLAPDRYGRRGPVPAQAVHGLGRGQERDQQADRRLHAVRAGVRLRLRTRRRHDRSDPRPRLHLPVAA